jgi:hypothetical protein
MDIRPAPLQTSSTPSHPGTGHLGARLVREDPFNCLGPYSDADPEDCTELRFMAPETHEMLTLIGERPHFAG